MLMLPQFPVPISRPVEEIQPKIVVPEFKSRFCLYKKDSDKEKETDIQLEEATVKLEVEYTDLEFLEERSLRKYIQQKAAKNQLYHQGDLSIIPPLQNPASPTLSTKSMKERSTLSFLNVPSTEPSKLQACYTQLIELVSIPKNTSNPSLASMAQDDNAPSAGTLRKTYVLCLLCEVSNFDLIKLFRASIDSFAETLKKQLNEVKILFKNSDQLKDSLATWFTYSVEYVTRCVDFLNVQVLPIVLYHSLLGESFVLRKSATQQAFSDDLQRFLNDVTFSNQPGRLTVTDLNATQDTSRTLTLTMDSQYKLHSSSTISNGWCKKWANELVSAERDPFQLRIKIEHFKAQSLEQLSSISKLLEQAKLSNYATYKLCNSLRKNTENSDLLLICIKRDKNNKMDSQAIQIIQLVEHYIKTQADSVTPPIQAM